MLYKSTLQGPSNLKSHVISPSLDMLVHIGVFHVIIKVEACTIGICAMNNYKKALDQERTSRQ